MKKIILSFFAIVFIVAILNKVNTSIDKQILVTPFASETTQTNSNYLSNFNFTSNSEKNFNEVTNKDEINYYINNYRNGNELDCTASNIPSNYKEIIYDVNNLPILVYDVNLPNGNTSQYYLPATQIGNASAEVQDDYYMYEVCLKDDGSLHYFDTESDGDSFDYAHLPILTDEQAATNELTKDAFITQYNYQVN